MNELASELYGGKIRRRSAEYCIDRPLPDTSCNRTDHTALDHLDFGDFIAGFLYIPHFIP